MANVNAAELIGKKIVIKNTANYYVVTAVEGDVVKTEFHMGNQEPKPVPLNARTLENFFASGVWVVEGEESAKATATDDIPEVEDIQPTKPEPKDKAEEKPKAKTTKAKGAAKPKAEPKTEAPKADAPKGGKYTYETYTTSKGKTGAKILGVSESDAVYQQAAAIHASGSYTKDKDGNKHYYLCFGPKYSAQAVAICAALNAGKPIANLQAIANGPAPTTTAKMYTAAEVEGYIRKAFGALATAMNEDVAQFEPIIKAALPQAA